MDAFNAYKFVDLVKFCVRLHALHLPSNLMFYTYSYNNYREFKLRICVSAYFRDIRADGIDNFIKHHCSPTKNIIRVRLIQFSARVHRHINQIKHGIRAHT